MINDSFIDEFRQSQKEEEELKKRFGVYNAREVEQYVKKLMDQLRAEEMIFQEKYEEVRSSLVAMTRERDMQSERVRTLDKLIEELPPNWEQILDRQGYVAIPKEVYDRLREIDRTYLRQIESIKEALNQTKEQHKVLSMQYQMTQEINSKLIEEKERLKNEAIKQQEDFKKEYKETIDHYKNVLKKQQVPLKKLQEIFSSSVSCIESIAETSEEEIMRKKEE